MSKLLEDKRKTRGLRMAALVGEAVEQDETFWGDGVWADEGSDDSFSEDDEEVKPDVFDSDFNDSEDSDEEDSDGEPNKDRVKVNLQR